MTRKPRKTVRPVAIDDRTVDSIIRLLAHQRGVPPVEAARELLAGLAKWFGIDFAREAERAVGEGGNED